MIILVAGESHTGKTALANQLIKITGYSCMSTDHIKMGLIKGGYADFRIEDHDELIAKKMQKMLIGIVDVCLENKQNMIIEGNLLTPELLKKVKNPEIYSIVLVLSQEYFENHSEDIGKYENVIEKRKFPMDFSLSDLMSGNNQWKKECIEHGIDFYEIGDNYESKILDILSSVEKIQKQ